MCISVVISVWQGRQKLAKFNKREFATLIIDILNDAKRRYGTSAASPTNNAAGQPRGSVSSFFMSLIAPFVFDLHVKSHLKKFSNKARCPFMRNVKALNKHNSCNFCSFN